MRRAGVSLACASLLAACASLLAACGGSPHAPAAHAPGAHAATAAPEAWTRWRAERRESLAGEDGWLTLVALAWLTPGGELRAGSDPHATLHLPASAPAYLGTFTVADGRVHFVAGPDAHVTHDGAPVTELSLVSDADGAPTKLECGSLVFYAIARGDRLGIRVKDRASPARQGFTGVPVYDYDPRLRVRAHFEPASPPRHLAIVNVLGMVEEEPCLGTLHFTLDGRALSLAAVAGGTSPADGLEVMLRDATSDADETYAAGRYLDVPQPDAGGDVWVDFNFLYTPPCAFTSFATCPLPPEENVLPIALRAGERYVHVE